MESDRNNSRIKLELKLLEMNSSTCGCYRNSLLSRIKRILRPTITEGRKCSNIPAHLIKQNLYSIIRRTFHFSLLDTNYGKIITTIL